MLAKLWTLIDDIAKRLSRVRNSIRGVVGNQSIVAQEN